MLKQPKSFESAETGKMVCNMKNLISSMMGEMEEPTGACTGGTVQKWEFLHLCWHYDFQTGNNAKPGHFSPEILSASSLKFREWDKN